MKRRPQTDLTADQLGEADEHIGAAIDILGGDISKTYMMQLINLSLRLKYQRDAKIIAARDRS